MASPYPFKGPFATAKRVMPGEAHLQNVKKAISYQ